MMSEEVRVRYAPSPTGFLHIGNARTALFNFLFARKMNGKFIIRVEDTDQKRNVAGGEESQLKYLKWLGLDWDEGVDVGGDFGPYRQMERLNLYQQYAEELLERGLAYYCYCSEEELEKERDLLLARGENPLYAGRCRHRSDVPTDRTPSIRFVVPKDKNFAFTDLVKGEVQFDSNEIGDWVIVKKDGVPTYNFAVVVDDYLMKISHVLRGDEHISNTPKQLMVYEALGWEAPTFAHMTLILNEERKKLSKRDADVIQFIEQYAALGYLPAALFNFIALLGWHPGGEEEIFSRDALIEIFDTGKLSKSPAVFGKEKLTWLNNQYMKRLSPGELTALCTPHLEKANLPVDDKTWIQQLVTLYQDYMSYGAEIVHLSKLFFSDVVYDEEAKAVLAEEHVAIILPVLVRELEKLDTFSADNVKAAVKATQKETSFKGKQLFMPIRVAVFGEMSGPDLMRSLELLGQEKVLTRLRGLIS